MTELKTYYITSQTILAKIIYFKNVLNFSMLTIFSRYSIYFLKNVHVMESTQSYSLKINFCSWVHPQLKFLSTSTIPDVTAKLYHFHSSLRHKIRFVFWCPCQNGLANNKMSKYLLLCSAKERKAYRSGMTWVSTCFYLLSHDVTSKNITIHHRVGID